MAQTIAAVIPWIGGLISLILTVYGVYLTYLAIQSGMNLPARKALYVAIILLIISVILACFTVGLTITSLLLSGGFAP